MIKDPEFQQILSDSMLDWREVHDLGLDILDWLEILVKPGIKKLAIQRSKELNRDRRGALNMLLLWVHKEHSDWSHSCWVGPTNPA